MNTIKLVEVASINLLLTNPPSRCNGALQPLVNYIKDRMARNLPPLSDSDRVLVGKDGVLGDGHRRVAALKQLGVTHVLAEFDSERDAAEIWRDCNSALAITSRQVVEAARLGLPIEKFPLRQQFNANNLIRLTGQRGYDLVLKYGASFYIYNGVASVLTYIDKRGDVDYGYKVLAWMLKHKQQRVVRYAMEIMETSVRTILNAIDDNRPLKMK